MLATAWPPRFADTAADPAIAAGTTAPVAITPPSTPAAFSPCAADAAAWQPPPACTPLRRFAPPIDPDALRQVLLLVLLDDHPAAHVHARTATLVECARVSRSWRAVAEPVLWRHPRFSVIASSATAAMVATAAPLLPLPPQPESKRTPELRLGSFLALAVSRPPSWHLLIRSLDLTGHVAP
ncbi:hypothetical protein HK405_013454, partial [Cladochytrium tenue]